MAAASNSKAPPAKALASVSSCRLKGKAWTAREEVQEAPRFVRCLRTSTEGHQLMRTACGKRSLTLINVTYPNRDNPGPQWQQADGQADRRDSRILRLLHQNAGRQ